MDNIELGDIVSLKSHPYLPGMDDILISGEPLLVPPVMIVTEIFESRNPGLDSPAKEYTCLWFSARKQKFERSRIKDDFLKFLFKAKPSPLPQVIKRGQLLSLTTMNYELVKKKLSMHFEDTSISEGNSSVAINALLSFLPPILHCIDIKETKETTVMGKNKTGVKDGRYQVKCMWFNSVHERFSEETIPLEALMLIPVINERVLTDLRESITTNKAIKIVQGERGYLLKPRSITARSGYYFLRGYDYVENRIVEINIGEDDKYIPLDTPFTNRVPRFDIEKNPKSCSQEFVISEIESAINSAQVRNAIIRIKYKNRNDQLSIRSLKDYKLIVADPGDDEHLYLIGHCFLRQSVRTFRLSRVQSLQELSLSF